MSFCCIQYLQYSQPAAGFPVDFVRFSVCVASDEPFEEETQEQVLDAGMNFRAVFGDPVEGVGFFLEHAGEFFLRVFGHFAPVSRPEMHSA